MDALRNLLDRFKEKLPASLKNIKVGKDSLTPIVGQVSWSRPPWMSTVASGAQKRGISNREVFVTLAGAAAIYSVAHYQMSWWERFPKPRTVSIHVNVPRPQALVPNSKPYPLTIAFSESAAQLKEDAVSLNKLISISPAIPGAWHWESDRELEYVPTAEWAIHQKYEVRFKSGVFPDHVLLESDRVQFTTQEFSGQIIKAELYQNPLDPKDKRIVATIKFTHPVDAKDFRSRISIKDRDQPNPTPFQVSFDSFNGEAYVRSDPVTIPQRDTEVKVTIAEGFKAQAGGDAFPRELNSSFVVAGVFNFFKLDSVQARLVPNERSDLDQIITLHFTTPISEGDLKKNLTFQLLPKDKPAEDGQPISKNHEWASEAEVTAAVRKLVQPLSYELLPNEHEASDLYSFRVHTPPRRGVLIELAKNTKSSGDYVLAEAFKGAVTVPDYPKEVRVMHNGSILSLQGERKLSIVARGMKALKYEIGRVIPSDLNHLVSLSGGDMVRVPSYYGSITEYSLVERFENTQSIGGAETGKSQYTSVDLGAYFKMGKESNRRGLFVLKVKGWDPQSKSETGETDQRFVLVTDLGVLVKKNSDSSRDVFVQSFKTGNPVAGAHIEVIGKNGIAVTAANADEAGHVSFPNLKDFDREKEPIAFVITHGADLSFMPYENYGRRLNYSRYDIGGEVASKSEDGSLRAFMFSERGLYRPGDDIHIGAIIKAQNWKSELEGVPVEMVVADPKGTPVFSERLQLGKEGVLEIKHRTEESSPTGTYTTEVYLLDDHQQRKQSLGSTTFRVEEFIADTLKISSKLSKERTEGWVSPADLKAHVILTNLFGTAAQNRRVTASVELLPYFPTFAQFKGYQFMDPARAERSQQEELDTQQTSETGEAEFALNLERFPEATYRLNFIANGFEAEGGRGVAAQSSVLVSPLAHMIGFKADGKLDYIKRGSQRAVHVIAIGPEVKPVEAKTLTIETVEVKWVSVLQQSSDGTLHYESVKKETTGEKKAITIPKAGLRLAVNSSTAGDFRWVIRDGKNQVIQEIPYSVVGAVNIGQKIEKTAEMALKLDKVDYAPGEEIEIQVTAPFTGAGLITIERDRVLAKKWFKAGTASSVQKIKVPADLEGNAYVTVAYVRSLDSREIYTNPLSYGVAPFSISKARRVNEIELNSPAKVKPGEILHVAYKTQKTSKILLFGVDEGILQVAGYHLPDPLSFFLKKRALEVQTDQILDLLLPEFSVVKAVSSPGGDASGGGLGKNLNPFKRKSDKPVVFWSGLIDAGPESRSVDWAVPDYFNGTVRVMAIAVNADSIGRAEATSLVRGDLVITPTLPLFATPGDEFELGLSVSNNVEGSGKGADVTLEAKTSAHLEILEPKGLIHLKINENGELASTVKVRANAVLGSGNLTLVARLGDKQGKSSRDLSIRPAQPYMTTLSAGALKAGFWGKDAVAVPIDRQLDPHFAVKDLSAATVPLALSRGLGKYLESYPYGCTEQLVSKAFPAIVLKGKPEFGGSPASEDQSFKETVRILRTRQTGEGGFGMYSGQEGANSFYTAYAFHYLTEAKDHGFPVPMDLLDRIKGYFMNKLKSDPQSLGEARVYAYALYLLARNGVVASNELAALRKQLDRLFKEGWKSDLTAAYVASAYLLYQQTDEANRIMAVPKIGGPIAVDWEYFYDGFHRDSELLYLTSKHFPALLKNLSITDVENYFKPITTGYYNSLTSAYSILALGAYSDASGTPASASLEVEERGPQASKPVTVPSGTFPKMVLAMDSNQVKIGNRSSVPIFWQSTQAGFDLHPPTKEMKNKIEVFHELQDLTGKVVTEAQVGKEYRMSVKVRSIVAQSFPNVAVVDLLPAGFDIVMDRKVSQDQGGAGAASDDSPSDPADQPSGDGDGDGSNGGGDGAGGGTGEGDGGGDSASFWSKLVSSAWADSRLAADGTTWEPNSVDVREDRVVLYGTVNPTVAEFNYKVKAVSRGTFVIPPAYAESMYDRSVSARGVNSKVTVKAP